MNCYNHKETPAVAVCQSCGKALCPDCALEVGDVLACSTECGNKQKTRLKLGSKEPKAYRITSYFMGFFGFFFLVAGGLIIFIQKSVVIGTFTILFSSGFLIAAYFFGKHAKEAG